MLLHCFLMLQLTLSLSELDVSFVYLLINALGWSIWSSVVRLPTLYYWVLGLVKLISTFVVRLKQVEVWFTHYLRVYVFLSYLRPHHDWFGNCHLLCWSCNFIYFGLSSFPYWQLLLSVSHIVPNNSWLAFWEFLVVGVFTLVINYVLGGTWLDVW